MSPNRSGPNLASGGPSIALDQHIVSLLITQLRKAQPGHCLRVDNVDSRRSVQLIHALRENQVDADIYLLADSSGQPPGESSRPLADPVRIAPDRAVELRNRKHRPLLLIVPEGEGRAASSLDNSFVRIPLIELIAKASARITRQLERTAASAAFQELRRVTARHRHPESWADFLSVLAADPTDECLGRELWRIGLVPDLGPNVHERLKHNFDAVAKITNPTRNLSSVADRLTLAGVREGDLRLRLQIFLESDAGVLPDARNWTRKLGEKHAGKLTFECWPAETQGAERIEALRIKAFRDDKDRLDATSKLAIGPDGQLLCRVSEDVPGAVVLRWATEPVRSDAVAHWLLDVVPPEDCRLPDTPALASSKVKGDKRRATLKLALEDAALDQGARFVVRLRAVDANGDELQLADSESAEADSQEFEIAFEDAPAVSSSRSASFRSLPEAIVAAAAGGVDERREDMPSWDLSGQVFGVRITGRRTAQMRICEVLVALQRRASAAGGTALAFSARARAGQPLTGDDVVDTQLTIPPALSAHRANFLTALRGRTLRDTAESAHWDAELTQLMTTYVVVYRRALDAAEPAALDALLAMDCLQLQAPTASGVVRGVVLLPLHPLRLAWIATHDRVLRGWASELDAISPKSARAKSVDLPLVRRVEPANFPFMVPGPYGEPALYAQELTHGSALYLVAGSSDTAADVDALCAVLGLTRSGVALDSNVGLVRERLLAYRAAHPGGPALRLLTLNPGEGALLAAALDPGADDQEQSDQERVEVIAYTDDASFTAPVSQIGALQRNLRSRGRSIRANHLAPPLALTVRRRAELRTDPSGAHLAIIQDVAQSGPAYAGARSDRAPSFHDLLTTTVTRRTIDEGGVTWQTAPAMNARGARPAVDLVALHRSHQRAMARCAAQSAGLFAAPEGGRTASHEDQTPVVQVSLDENHLAEIRSIHRRADWVLTLDKYLGLDLYNGDSASGIGDSFILDYAPDFVEGMTPRLTVTTSQRQEVERVLGSAMRRMGLIEVQQSVRSVLGTLAVVSGRLALRLLGESTLATEAVSLAALVRHLDARDQLKDLIVIPVDAHPEIFGSNVRAEEDTARRCDLLLIRLTARTFHIECVEVKARQDAELPTRLADRITDQLQDTEQLLISRFFAMDPPRVDSDLQRARLAGLMHHYADRAHANGLITAERIDEIHRFVDRIEDQRQNATISLKGYVISLEGDKGFPAKHRGIPIAVISGRDLGQVGFTATIAPVVTEAFSLPPRAEAVSGPPSSSPSPSVPSSSPSVASPSPAPSLSPAPSSSPSPSPSGAPPLVAPDQTAGLIEVALGVDDHGREATWRLSTKGSPHAFIVGIPGQGKSVTTRRIIREMSNQGLPSLVFDCHGDMADQAASGVTVIDASKGLPFSPFEFDLRGGKPVNAAAWEIAEVITYVCRLGDIQRNNVYRGLVEAYESCGWIDGKKGECLPTVMQFAAAVEKAEERSRGRHARDRIRPLTDFGLFQEHPDSSFEPLTPSGLVIDVSSLGLEEVQLAAGAFLIRKVYRDMFRWGQTDRLRLALVLDEAHRMSGDVTLPKIMKEGRKYGVAVIVASQHIDDFHRDVLANAGMKLVFRTNFPASKAVANFLRPRDGQDLGQRIEQLDVGTAYLSTPDEVRARRVTMTR